MRIHSVNNLNEFNIENSVNPSHFKNSKLKLRKRAIKMLEIVGIGDAKRRIDEYTYQFSGGMQQRVMIAMALACNPLLLIADEPTTALDVTIQAQILWLLNDLQKDFKASILLITHDLSIVAQFCDRLAIMYAGKIVERGNVLEVFNKPLHPYTKGLLNVLPKMDQKEKRFREIKGFPPDLIEIPKGCAFYHRCDKGKELCEREMPKEIEISSTHKVSCFYKDD
jgi:oligopeptide/dipeptide ABC transporter ATP-binding protein